MSGGELALQKVPSSEIKIKEVMNAQSFDISDLSWIAATLSASIRLTVEENTFQSIVKDHYPWLPKDCVFGLGPCYAHLYFSWVNSDGEQGKKFGHFDLLSPCTNASSRLFAKMLPPDATCIQYTGVTLVGASLSLLCIYL